MLPGPTIIRKFSHCSQFIQKKRACRATRLLEGPFENESLEAVSIIRDLVQKKDPYVAKMRFGQPKGINLTRNRPELVFALRVAGAVYADR